MGWSNGRRVKEAAREGSEMCRYTAAKATTGADLNLRARDEKGTTKAAVCGTRTRVKIPKIGRDHPICTYIRT